MATPSRSCRLLRPRVEVEKGHCAKLRCLDKPPSSCREWWIGGVRLGNRHRTGSIWDQMRRLAIWARSDDAKSLRMTGFCGEPGRNRTFNQQIKSLLLCQLSYGPTRGEWPAHGEGRAPTGKR
jgi:hypothetical protein